MLHLISADRLLILGSTAWLAALALAPSLHTELVTFCASIAIIAGNAAWSLWTLTRKRQILIALNLMQIVLFGVLNYQLASVFGSEHYRYDRTPQFCDWAEFTVAHVLRAADVLDALDEYGLAIQSISHNSTASGILLVCMHLTVDVFLLGLVLRWARRYWHVRPRETRLAQGRREFAWLLITLALFVGFAVAQDMAACDWLLWPLDNLLRLVDVGDVLQIFGWQLHSVEPSYWTRGAGLLFRLAAGVWMARLIIYWRLTVFCTWGVSITELTELLDDADAQVRRNAAIGLGQSGPAAHLAVPALIDTLHDLDREVRCEAARALGYIGPAACLAVDRLADAVWLEHAEMRLAAIEALGQIGPDARSAVHSLICVLKVCAPATRQAVIEAIEKIAPGLLRRLPADHLQIGPRLPAPPSKRDAAWLRCVAAARSRQEQENAALAVVLILLAEGFFGAERDVESIMATLAARTPSIEPASLFGALWLLTAHGKLVRRQNDGKWRYLATAISPGADASS